MSAPASCRQQRPRPRTIFVDSCSHKCEHRYVPESEIVFYREGETVLFEQWLNTLPVRSQGHELRRPIADLLRDGIYELRPTYQGVHYRILYFFSGKSVVVISHGLSKESTVPAVEINRAMERKKKYEANPKAHGWKG